MRSLFVITLFTIIVSVSGVRANTLTEYLENRYSLRYINSLPEKVKHPMLIISTRFFKPEMNFMIKRGVHPRYEMFLFISGTIGDTVYLMPIKSLREATPFLPVQKDFLVYVDGHGKTFDKVIERGADLAGRFAVTMVLFDWPTDYMALRKTASNADEVTVGFIKAMREFDDLHSRYYNETSVSAIFHSMGNHIIRNVTHPKLLSKMPQHLFSNIILNAAAVKQNNHETWVEKLNIQKRLYITMNDEDRTLMGAKLLRVSHQLGLGTRVNRADNAFYVNFSNIATIEHNLFMGKSETEKNNPYIFQFYNQAFHGKEVRMIENMGFQILSPSESNFLFSRR